MPLRGVNELHFKSWETKCSRGCETKSFLFQLPECQVWLLKLVVFHLAVPDPARPWWSLAAPGCCCSLEVGNSPSWEGEKL